MQVACQVTNCTNPVIGQCTGYGGPCGRFYCAAHSASTLCQACAERKSEDERKKAEAAAVQQVYDEYSRTAERIQKVSETLGERAVGYGGSLALCFGALVVSALSHGKADWFAGLLLAAAILDLGYMLYNGMAVVPQRRKAAAVDAERTRPGFAQFYNEWSRKRSKEQLVNGLLIGGAIAAVALGVVAAVTESGSRKSEIADGVEEALKRRGY